MPPAHRRAIGKRIFIWVIAVVLVLAGLGIGAIAVSDVEQQHAQSALDPFYTPPDPLIGTPGTVIRTEPLGVDVPGATALRMLYISERPDGTPAASGAMLFIPNSPVPTQGRPVVAWAHGTVGMGDACAPSRTDSPLSATTVWLDSMMRLGWVVVATDYVGLGTPGDELFLVNEAEMRDVVNSVRAARNVPSAAAGSRYAVWGHSQGGHASLWTGLLGETYAPELDLVGVAAAAPAANISDLVNSQWNTAVGWGIGPEIMISWPLMDAALDPNSILSRAGSSSYHDLAQGCLSDGFLDTELLARSKLGETFFGVNPNDQPAWSAYATSQTPTPMPHSMPVFIAQGTADDVVIPSTNAALIASWCMAGSTVQSLWLGGVNHLPAATIAGPAAVEWIADRFTDREAPSSCWTPK